MKEVLRVYWFLLFLFLVTSLAHGQVRRDSASRIRFGPTVPATCNPGIGQVFFIIDPGTPLGMQQCLATDTWSPMVGSMSGAGANNQVAVFTGPAEIEGTVAFTFDSSTGLLGLVNDTASIRLGASADAQIHRGNAADIVEQRRGTNNQQWNIYDTFTDFSTYDRLSIYVGGGPPVKIFAIEAESTDAGTGGIDLRLEALPGLSGGVVRLVTGTASVQLGLGSFNFSPANTISVLNVNNFGGGGTMDLGLAQTTTQIGIDLRIASIQPGTGQRDSHSFNMSGRSDDGNPFEAQWKTQVVMDSDSGDSSWVLSERVNCCPSFVTAMQVTNTTSNPGQFTLPHRGPHSFGIAIDFQHQFTFGNDYFPVLGADLTGVKFRLENNVIGAAGMTTSLYGMDLDIGVNTQAASESIADIATLNLEEPGINDLLTGGGLITQAATLRIGGAPTEGVANFAILVESGLSQFGGTIQALNSAAFGLLNETASGTNPTLLPRRSELDNGIGSLSVQTINIITNSVSRMQFSETRIETTLPLQGAAASAYAVLNEAASATNPTLIPSNGAFTTGIGGVSGEISLIVGSVEAVNIDSAGVVITGNLAVSGAGPHSIAGVTSGAIQLLIGSTFTSDGSSDIASGIFHTPAIVGAPGDTTSLTGTTLTAGITTQTATESISTISQLQINEPFITDNLTGSILTAQTLLINGTPTEGNLNLALRSTGEGGMLIRGQQFQLGVSSMLNNTQVRIAGATFTSGGFTDEASKFRVEGVMTGAPGDTDFLAAISVHMTTIVTQTATETIDDITTLKLDEPIITDNLTGDITNASTLLITGAPTEGVSNFAILVDSGATLLGGPLEHTGTTLGFFSTTPATQPAAYTRNATIVESRTLLASASATALNNNNVLAALIADLQSLGLIQ
jgi:hypothetical protein